MYMKLKQSAIAFLVISAAGTLLHFMYEWSGENPIVGIFSAVNESIWEHLKLLFFPAVAWSAIAYLVGKKHYENDAAATLLGILGGMFTIVSVYYTYSGILGFDIPAVDIALYYFAVLIFLGIRGLARLNGVFSRKSTNLISLAILIIMGVLFAVFTFYTPKLGIFQPPA